MYNCSACGKSYTSKQNLNLHYERQPLCVNWLKLQTTDEKIKKLIDYIDNEYDKKDNYNHDDYDKKSKRNNFYSCDVCNKIFSNSGNLNVHLKSSIICQKMKKYTTVYPYAFLEELSTREKKEIIEEIKEEKEIVDSEKIDDISNEIFIAPKYNLCHIIWNVFLIDKELKLTQEIIEENNIGYIIAILPDKETYYEKVKVNVEHSIMIYEGHEPLLDFERFDIECKRIELLRKERKNIFVFCNNGYQRSIPFLCHYLVNHHKDEVPTFERAIDIILPQVDKANYNSTRNNYIQSMKLLFKKE